jgi:hypothetical protein
VDRGSGGPVPADAAAAGEEAAVGLIGLDLRGVEERGVHGGPFMG